MVLVEDDGETVLRAGECAAFPKGRANGHQLINLSGAPAQCLEVGSRSPGDICRYSDIDMVIDARDDIYRRRDGTPLQDGVRSSGESRRMSGRLNVLPATPPCAAPGTQACSSSQGSSVSA